MTQAETFLDRLRFINDSLTGKQRQAMILNLKADIDVYCIDTADKKDGSTVYQFDDHSFVRVQGMHISPATKTDFGRFKLHHRLGRLSLRRES